MNIGERVRQARLERHMTADALANASNLSKGFISQVERGLSNPSLDSLERITAALDIPLTALLEASEQAPAPSTGEAAWRPRLVPAGVISRRSPGLTRITAGEAGTVVLVDFQSGDRLGALPVSRKNASACCYVVRGEVVLRQDGVELRAGGGDTLVWNVAAVYELECVSPIGASLLLVIPSDCTLPELTRKVPVATRVTGSIPQGAPFSLVAMRARRNADPKD
jgi:transcriptional regulator with XRE-family HTH domain